LSGIAVKLEESTDEAFGSPPQKRPVGELLESGIVALDKPCGPSSHEVTSWVKRLTGARKAGHAGTLDPNVSGVLPVGINGAVKALGFLLCRRKEYAGIIAFHRRIAESDVRRGFAAFTGDISQLPPVRSAVRRRERKRKVYYLQLAQYVAPEALFLVGCEAGTYVRKLCFDMGSFLGCGANMLELRRTRAGAFGEAECVTLHELSDAMWLWKERGDERELRRCVRPVEDALLEKKVWLRDSAVDAVCNGARLGMPGIAKVEDGIEAGETVALMTQKEELVAFARANAGSESMVMEAKGIAAETIRVLMKAGTYPRGWKTSEKPV